MAAEGTVRRRADAVASVDAEGRSALLDLSEPGAAPLILDGIGALIWQRVDGSRSDRQIAEELSAQFDEDPEVIASNVVDFLDQLDALGLLESAIS